MKLSDSFIDNIHVTYGQEGKIWLSNLTSLLDKLSVQWNFQIINLVKNMSYNFVAVVKLPSGLAILKTAPFASKLMVEAEWLAAHTKSVPKILYVDRINNAYVMKKIDPGHTLKHVVQEGNDEKATRIIAQVILDLQCSNISHQMKYPHISEHVSCFTFLRGHMDTSIIDFAESLFKDLCTNTTNDIILHGDLHHDNILENGNAWGVIDPHGYVGDPCAEVGPMFYNPLNCFPSYRPMKKIIETRLNILAEMLPFDMDLIKSWAFCLSMRSVAWDIEGFSIPNSQTIQVAKILSDSFKKIYKKL